MLSGLQPACAGKTYIRVLHDIKTVLTHQWAVADLLAQQLPSLMRTITLLDSFAGHKRKLGDHAEWPDDNWLNPVQLEVIFLSHAGGCDLTLCGERGHGSLTHLGKIAELPHVSQTPQLEYQIQGLRQ